MYNSRCADVWEFYNFGMENPPINSEAFGNVPQASESFGTVPHNSENFRTLRKASERKESHTLTVREVARMFEQAGVARTERSIINWCQPNKLGVARLDCYFDPNEHKYFITGQSAELAIKEEQAKSKEPALGTVSEPVGTVPKSTEESSREPSSDKIKSLEQEVFDLRIMNKGKDYLIDQMAKERAGFITQLMESSRRTGELETRLLQLEDGFRNESNASKKTE